MVDEAKKVAEDTITVHELVPFTEKELETKEIFKTLPAKPEDEKEVRIEQISRELMSFFQRELRKRLYYFVNIHRARNAAVQEIKYIDEPRLDELEFYLEEIENA